MTWVDGKEGSSGHCVLFFSISGDLCRKLGACLSLAEPTGHDDLPFLELNTWKFQLVVDPGKVGR